MQTKRFMYAHHSCSFLHIDGEARVLQNFSHFSSVCSYRSYWLTKVFLKTILDDTWDESERWNGLKKFCNRLSNQGNIQLRWKESSVVCSLNCLYIDTRRNVRAINSTSQTLTARTYIKNISSRIPNAGTNPRKYVFARSTGKHRYLRRNLARFEENTVHVPARRNVRIYAYVYVYINCYIHITAVRSSL